jgi:hypothetical protein
MRKLSVVVVMALIGAALVACTERPPSSINSTTANAMAYERPAPVVRAPLAPPQGYASPPPLGTSPSPPSPYGNSPAPSPLYGNFPDEGADPQTAGLGWRASPRWSAIEGDGCIEVEEGGQTGHEAQMKIEECARQARRGEAPAPAETMAPPDY